MYMVRRLSDDDHTAIIKTNTIENCPVKPEGIKIAKKIFSPELGTLEGKITITKSIPVHPDIFSIPRSIIRANWYVVICVDVMYINIIPFFVTLLRVIKFQTSQDIPYRTKNTYITCIKLIILVYRSAGFVVRMFLMDGGF